MPRSSARTIGLGKLLGLSVIAEGIENPVTAELLRSMGCEEGQGYHFGPAMPAADFERKFLSDGGLQAAGIALVEQAATAA